ncbi:hypothetical protein SVIO_038310 [Streptomyces violaceusniger]|uniref:ABM domain-containing protein n=1 Tax=Streptomyces violaceusniger TaxID=68280 RepID=A0A4D4L3R2_STRVO|nr:hypothetical protein SVIO_038310 [Streptomyces violaceusniger]
MPSVVKINVLTVPEEQREVLEKRFASRAGTVENSDGFEWFELLRPVEGTDTYLVYTRWRSEEDFQAWMEGPMKAAHQRGGEDAPSGSPPRPAPPCGPSRSSSRPRPSRADRAPCEHVSPLALVGGCGFASRQRAIRRMRSSRRESHSHRSH